MNRRMERKGVEARDQEGTRTVTMCVACLQARDEQQNMVTIYNRCHMLMINTNPEKYWVCLYRLPTQTSNCYRNMGPDLFQKGSTQLI